MANVIKIKQSSTAGNTPTTSNLSQGELAINTADQKLYSSDGSSVFELTGGSGGGGSSAINIEQAYTTSASSYSSGAYRDLSGLSVSITPSSSDSKILVTFTVSMGGSFGQGGVRAKRGSTYLPYSSESDQNVGAMVSGEAAGHRSTRTMSFTYLDSPNTTSATTYKLQGYATSNFFINRPTYTNSYATPGMSSIVVQEITQ